MRIAAALLLLAAASSAHADAKIQGMTPGFKKELAACEIEVRGLARVLTGLQGATVPADERAAVDADLAALTTANTTVTAHCTEVAALVAFLDEHASAAYKTVERELDTRDNAVRRARKLAKQALVDIAPITRRAIPRIKRTSAPTTAPDKAAPTAFPSKRAVVLPALGGTWSVSGSTSSDTATYTDKFGTATVTTRAFDRASCAHQRKAFEERSDTPAAQLQISPEAEKLGAQWSARLVTRSAHAMIAMCVERGMGGVLATVDYTPAERKVHDAELTRLAVAMLAAQLETK